jgi:hypothetical protein
MVVMDRDAAFEVQLARVLDEIGRLQNKLGAGELTVPGSKGQPPGWSSASAATAATPPDITERFRPARHGELATVNTRLHQYQSRSRARDVS